MFVKPAKPHLVVRDPRSRVRLPVFGGKVKDSSFWIRRLNCGDVLPTTQEAIALGREQALAAEAIADKAEATKAPVTESATKDAQKG